MSTDEYDEQHDKEIVAMLEESWYWSTIEDMIVLFKQHGRENVLNDLANLLLERENAKAREQEKDV